MTIGDYVRTKKGYISKIKKIEKINGYDYTTFYFDGAIDKYGWDDGNIYDETQININDTTFKEEKEYILKSSPNIIDLIEVGDYVNGCRVVEHAHEKGRLFVTYTYIGGKGFTTFEDYLWELTKDREEDIKTIVTHEQIEAMQYKVGE